MATRRFGTPSASDRARRGSARGSPSGAATTSPMRTALSPAARKRCRDLRRPRPAPTTTIMPMPQLKVRSISASATPPVCASQPNTGGTGDRVEVDARRRRRSGSTRGMLSGKPPPVMWASALMPRRSRGSRRAAASHRSASARAAPRRASAPGANGAGASQASPACSTIRRTSEKPLECTPEEAQAEQHVARRRCPARGSSVPRSTAPTAKPARS